MSARALRAPDRAFPRRLPAPGEDALTTYTFNTHVAKHTFCKICGVQSFYSPRSNPDGYGVNPNCIVSDTVAGIRYSHFDGQHW